MVQLPDSEFTKKLIDRTIKDIPPLPAVVSRVLDESSKADTTPHRLEQLIQTDPGLSAKVLRVVNSAYYGLPGQVSGLSQACMILGIQQIRNLVLSVSALAMIQPKTERQQRSFRLFWLHSFGTAAATQLVAKKKQYPLIDVDSLFVAGLLHDLGRSLLLVYFSEFYDAVLERSIEEGKPIAVVEKELLGYHHGEIGSLMIKNWGLPPLLSQILLEHEGPFSDTTPWQVLATHIGDTLTKKLYVAEGQDMTNEFDPKAVAWLSFSEEELLAVEQETDLKVAAASEIFGQLLAA